jgi:hypothetical protein
MLKLGIIGIGKEKDQALQIAKQVSKFSVVAVHEPNAQHWEDAYFSSDFDAFLNQVDAVMFCSNTPQFAPMVEKAIYAFKHIFVDGMRIEETGRMREWGSLIYEAGVVFHSGNQLSVTPTFLAIWPYLQTCNWLEINMSMPFKDDKHFRSMLLQAIELVLKATKGGIEKVHKSDSKLFGFDYPEHFSLWLESAGGTVVKLNMNYDRHETNVSGRFATDGKHFEVDFLSHKVWELKKFEDNSAFGVLFNSENDLELQDILPEIKKVPRQVIYFDSLSKELLNFYDNIQHKLSPLTGIDELLEVSLLCDKVFPAASSYQAC